MPLSKTHLPAQGPMGVIPERPKTVCGQGNKEYAIVLSPFIEPLSGRSLISFVPEIPPLSPVLCLTFLCTLSSYHRSI